jgi:serine/threonine-protein kinase
VIHRDLKPDNVMVASDGRVVITDFGIARDPMAATAGPTMGGGMVGTPAYMAPEQVDARSPIDARTDIYALGVMLFELFTGELPFKGGSVLAIAAARLYTAPPDPSTLRPDLPGAISEVILKCLARDASERFASAQDVQNALASASPTLPAGSHASRSVAPPPSSRTRTSLHEKRVAVLPFRNLGPSEDD